MIHDPTPDYSFQDDVIRSIFSFYNNPDNRQKSGLIEVPGGGGKTTIMGNMIAKVLAKKPIKRFLVIVDNTKICQQNYETIQKINHEFNVGICCSTLGRKDMSTAFNIVSGVDKSVLNAIKKNHSFFDGLLIDEAHDLASPTTDSIIKILKQVNPNIIIVGFTASPYKNNKLLYGEKAAYDELVFQVKHMDLVHNGVLSPYEIPMIGENVFSEVHSTVHSEKFDEQANSLKNKTTDDLSGIISQIHSVAMKENRKKIIIFIPNSNVASIIEDKLKLFFDKHTITYIDSYLDKNEIKRREKIFEDSEFGILLNITKYSKGYDHPSIDMVVLLVKLMSLAKYIQMLARGSRRASKKQNCIVLDFGGNIQRHGPMDEYKTIVQTRNKNKNKNEIKPDEFQKQDDMGFKDAIPCPQCGIENKIGSVFCLNCFSILKSKVKSTFETEVGLIEKSQPIPVFAVNWYIKRTFKGNIPMLACDYMGVNGHKITTQLFCLDHEGKAKDVAFFKFRKLIKNTSGLNIKQLHLDVNQAFNLVQNTHLRVNKVVIKNDKYKSVVKVN